LSVTSWSPSAVALMGLLALGCGKGGRPDEGIGGQRHGDGNASGGGLNLGDITNGSGSSGIGSGTVIDPSAACAKGTAQAALTGVNMFVMFDRSTSMSEIAVQNGASRWTLTSEALSSFFASPSAAGLKVALRFFPHDTPTVGCNEQDCSAQACSTPLVGLGGLTAAAAPDDAQEVALLEAIKNAAPMAQDRGMRGMVLQSGGTPLSTALGGALQWASAEHERAPGENAVVVLVTDGQPNGCDQDIGNIAALAANALMVDGTRTYAIGLTGSQEADMDRIAAAGGTTKGIFVADGASTTQDLLDALGAIRGAIVDCDFPMPEPEPGVEVEPAFINVNFTPSNGKTSTLVQIANESACSADPRGWYYDDALNPTRIVLCKSICDSVTADPNASLEILLGCPTSTEVPK